MTSMTDLDSCAPWFCCLGGDEMYGMCVHSMQIANSTLSPLFPRDIAFLEWSAAGCWWTLWAVACGIVINNVIIRIYTPDQPWSWYHHRSKQQCNRKPSCKSLLLARFILGKCTHKTMQHTSEVADSVPNAINLLCGWQWDLNQANWIPLLSIQLSTCWNRMIYYASAGWPDLISLQLDTTRPLLCAENGISIFI